MITQLGQTNFAIDGDVFNSSIVANIFNSVDCKKMEEELQIRQSLLQYTPVEEIDKRELLIKEIQVREKEISYYKQNALLYAERLRNEKNIERKNRIIQLLEHGKIKEAFNAITDEEIDKEIEEHRKNGEKIAETCQLKASSALLNYDDPNRIEIAERYFNKSLQYARTQSNLYAYGHFLSSINRVNDAIVIFEECLNLPNLDHNTTEYILYSLINCCDYIHLYDKSLYYFILLITEHVKTLNEMHPDSENEKMYKSGRQSFYIEIYLLANVIKKRANDMFDRKEYDGCFNLLEKMELPYREMVANKSADFLLDVADSLYNISNKYFLLGKFDECQNYFNKAFDVAKDFFSSGTVHINSFTPISILTSLISEVHDLHSKSLVSNDQLPFYLYEFRHMVIKLDELLSETKEKENFRQLGIAYYYLGTFDQDTQQFVDQMKRGIECLKIIVNDIKEPDPVIDILIEMYYYLYEGLKELEQQDEALIQVRIGKQILDQYGMKNLEIKEKIEKVLI